MWVTVKDDFALLQRSTSKYMTCMYGNKTDFSHCPTLTYEFERC